MMLWFELRNVLYLRKATKDENFNNVPYYDEQEKEFWETHRITRNGIKKLTAFDEKEGDKVVVWNEYRRIEIFEKATNNRIRVSTADSMLTDGGRVIFYKDSEEVLFFDPKECYYRSFKLE